MTRIAAVLALSAALSVALSAALSPVLLAAPAHAGPAAVRPCGDGERVDTVAEPWEDNTASYAEGRVRVAKLDTIEPAGAPVHLLILSPPMDESGMFRQCRVVSLAEGSGFWSMDFAGRKAAYDPGRGLTLTIPVKVYDPSAGDGAPRVLTVTIDQSTGRIAAETAR